MLQAHADLIRVNALVRADHRQHHEAAVREQAGVELVVDRGVEFLTEAAELAGNVAPEHALTAGPADRIGEIHQIGNDGGRECGMVIADPSSVFVDQPVVRRYQHDIRLAIEGLHLGAEPPVDADIVGILLADIFAAGDRKAPVERSSDARVVRDAFDHDAGIAHGPLAQ